MVRVNKTQFPEKLRRQVWEILWNYTKQSPEALARKFSTLFTRSEIVMLEKRLAIPLLLNQGLSYKEIGRMIDVSPATISSVKHHFTKKKKRSVPLRQPKYRPVFPYNYSPGILSLMKPLKNKRR